MWEIQLFLRLPIDRPRVGAYQPASLAGVAPPLFFDIYILFWKGCAGGGWALRRFGGCFLRILDAFFSCAGFLGLALAWFGVLA